MQLVRAELSEKTDFLREQVQLTATQARHEVEHAKADLAEIGQEGGRRRRPLRIGDPARSGRLCRVHHLLIAGIGAIDRAWAGALVVTLLYGAVAAGLAIAGANKVKEVGRPGPGDSRPLQEPLRLPNP